MNCVVNTLLWVAIFFLGLLLLPGIPPNISFEAIQLTPSIKLEGKFAPNYVFDKASKLIEGQFVGAESILLNGSTLYTAVAGGKLLKLEDRIELKLNRKLGAEVNVQVKEIARFGKNCQANLNENCKHVIGGGLRFDQSGNIVLVDVGYGVFSVDSTTGKSGYLFTVDSPVANGHPLKLPDDLDIGSDGTIYFSDLTSSTNTIDELTIEKLFDSSGRLMKYDPKTKTISVLLTGLICANGVQLSENEDFVLVAESVASRVTRYYLKGPKAGTSDVFIDGLPGIPDNIRQNGRGGYYIALAGPRSFLIDNLSDHPQLRKLLFRLGWLARLPLELLKGLGIQSLYLSQLHHFMTNYGPLGLIMPTSPVVVDVDARGNIRRILTTRRDEIQMATQLTVGRDYAYFGGFISNQIWRIAMADLEK